MALFPGYVPPVEPTVAGSAVPPGWARYELIAALAVAMGWTDGVEIGVSFGQTFRHLLAACPRLALTGVDTWSHNANAPEPDDWTEPHHDAAFAAAQAIADEFGDRARLLRGPSAEMAAQVPNGSLDFVWIDGDHSTEAVLADIEAWMPKLRPEGWLLGHDINWDMVRLAVDEVVPAYLIGPDAVWFRPLHPAPGWWANRFASGLPGART